MTLLLFFISFYRFIDLKFYSLFSCRLLLVSYQVGGILLNLKIIRPCESVDIEPTKQQNSCKFSAAYILMAATPKSRLLCYLIFTDTLWEMETTLLGFTVLASLTK